VKVCLTIDLDSKNQNNISFDVENLDFDYAEELQVFCRHVPCTLFARIDQQIRDRLGLSYVYDMACMCDAEIGWHPHIFELGEQVKQSKSEDFIVEQLEEMYQHDIVKQCRMMRIGACQGGNLIASWIEDKFDIDSSSMPGCKRMDEIRHYDWSRCGNDPYRPSREDYQSPGDLQFCEIPIAVVPTLTSYDIGKKLRVLSPAYKSDIFEAAIADLNREHVVLAFHGDELSGDYKDDLYECGLSNVIANLDLLETKYDVEYVSLSQLHDWWCPRFGEEGR
jgi:hypothetical protein